MDGKWRKKLYKDKLITPRALVAVPTIGQIYGSDWSSQAFIYKAAMDGHKFEKIVTNGVVRSSITRMISWQSYGNSGLA